ncbi:MAG: trypsin-like peptidase domain-containing protein [Acidobacteria bacterium]|nr:trypsin-like peptidase domain-containing protein [Acidobacteriota bacterium]
MYRANALVRPGIGAVPADFDQIVIPISELKIGFGLENKFGTGFCLDPNCRLIATNYHVAAIANPSKIDGQPIVDRFLATGPEDEGATVNVGPTAGAIKYTLSRDLAILELRRPLAHHHGAAFSLDEPQPGLRVEIYAYPKEANRASRKLLRFSGTYKGETTSGLMAFDYAPVSGDRLQPGASGGVVVDAQSHRIVGVLTGVDEESASTAVAVPAQSLADFVTKVEPFLATTLFPSRGITPPDADDIYPKYVAPTTDGLQHRGAEPVLVKQLRETAQQLAEGMRNLIAVQRLAWGSGNKEASLHAAYEVRVIDGAQKFREFPDGKAELDEIPLPPLSHSIVPALEWSELPEMVGKQLHLKVHQAPDVVVNDKQLKVFQYSAGIEDGVCGFTYVNDHILFKSSKTVRTSCYGEVWTDEDMNIVRMSEHYELPGERKVYHVVVTYGLLTRAGEAARTIPMTIAAKTEDKNRVDWCRGQFTDYQIFGSQVKILAEK